MAEQAEVDPLSVHPTQHHNSVALLEHRLSCPRRENPIATSELLPDLPSTSALNREPLHATTSLHSQTVPHGSLVSTSSWSSLKHPVDAPAQTHTPYAQQSIYSTAATEVDNFTPLEAETRNHSEEYYTGCQDQAYSVTASERTDEADNSALVSESVPLTPITPLPNKTLRSYAQACSRGVHAYVDGVSVIFCEKCGSVVPKVCSLNY